MTKIRGQRTTVPFKWTPENEAELEEILIKNSFDFRSTTREFCKHINKGDENNFYELDVKTVQLRWTDIEIRKHRLNQPTAEPEPVKEQWETLQLKPKAPTEDGSRLAQLRQAGASSPPAESAGSMFNVVEDTGKKDIQSLASSM